MDARSGDLICTQCGAVLDDHLRDETAEWNDFSNDNDPSAGHTRARCGEVVDENKYVGGLMPTKVSTSVYNGTAVGGTGSGAGAGTSEEKYRLALIRGRLKRTHNMIENMVEQGQKERYAEVVLERRARDARMERGEVMEMDVENENGVNKDGGIAVDGDYEGLMDRRREEEVPKMVPVNARKKKPAAARTRTDYEMALISVKDKKWSLPDAILLHGTFGQVQQFGAVLVPANRGEWTQSTLETERTAHVKKFDATLRASTHKLYVAFTILEKAALKLDLVGMSNATYREAVGWLVKFVNKNDGLRIKGIGSSSLASGVNGKESLSLSLFDSSQNQDGMSSIASLSASKSKSKSSSLATELHRYRQYASLGSAILYLSCKRTGIGRTLTEVCLAFGTYQVGEATEPLVRPKNCSRAMQELRMVLPEIVLPSATTIPIAALSSSSSTAGMFKMELDAQAPVKVTPTYGLPRTSSTSSTASLVASMTPLTVKSEYIPNTDSIVVNTEEAALADLTCRMGTSLNLPQCAISAATAVAIQCTRDARASAVAAASSTSNSKKLGNGKSHIRPKRRGRGKHQSSPSTDSSPEVIAVASILLVCMAGGTMQRLARQALSNAAAATSSSSLSSRTYNSMSNPLDDLKDDLSSSMVTSDATGTTATSNAKSNVQANNNCNNNHDNAKQKALSSWTAWNNQPSWHRDVSHMEQCTGVPRRTIISYYSNNVHPRRLYFLGVSIKSEEEDETAMSAGVGLLHNIVAAVPLMSLRNL